MATVILQLRGDQLGTYSSLSGTGNGVNRAVTLEDVEALGTASQMFEVTVEQVSTGDTQFENGQFVTIRNADGDVVVQRTNVQPDTQQGLGAGDEHLILNQRNVVIDLGGVPVGPEEVQYANADEVAGSDGDDDGELDFADFPCFAEGTLIDTPTGPRPVETLAPGDMLATNGDAHVQLRWTASRRVDLSQADAASKPVAIRAGSLGPDLPERDLVVSPDHRVLLRNSAVEYLFDQPEGLAPSKALMSLPGVRQMMGKRHITYFSLLTEYHAVIRAEGLPVETLFPGRMALGRLGVLAQVRIMSLIPGLSEQDRDATGGDDDVPDLGTAYPPACRLLSMREARDVLQVQAARNRNVSGDEAWTRPAAYPLALEMRR
ncbi:Hint domain-containing protein [Tateyamaria sp. SN3-11]|uniref:Hint domain-containing protein n=1 Tax=Tateyamaria sp. SN3-11 TaxID=3092147 RepID=UPI0039ECF153